MRDQLIRPVARKCRGGAVSIRSLGRWDRPYLGTPNSQGSEIGSVNTIHWGKARFVSSFVRKELVARCASSEGETAEQTDGIPIGATLPRSRLLVHASNEMTHRHHVGPGLGTVRAPRRSVFSTQNTDVLQKRCTVPADFFAMN